MKTTRHLTLAACTCAAWLTPSVDAQACSYGPGGARVIWPPPMEEGIEVPIDTQVWVGLEGLSIGEADLRLEDGDGSEVEVDVEIIEATTDYGPSWHVALFTPRSTLEPSSSYTIALTSPGPEGRIQSTERTFETGAGVLVQPQPATPRMTYVAMEGIEDGGDSCDTDGADAFHVLRWEIAPTQGFFLSILGVKRGDEPERTLWRTFDADGGGYGTYMFNGDSSVGLDEYPCLTHTLIDVTGREVSSKSSCEPDLCVIPPRTEYGTTDYNSSGYQDFIFNPGTWDAMATDCTLATSEPATILDGCATTPASPVPHTPLALGGLALLALLTRRTKDNERSI